MRTYFSRKFFSDGTTLILYRVEQNNSFMFEIPAFLLPSNLGQPMHSPSALTEHVSLNLAGFFLLDPVCLPIKGLRIGLERLSISIDKVVYIQRFGALRGIKARGGIGNWIFGLLSCI